MITTEKIISLFLIFCILISCISFSFASEIPETNSEDLNIYGRMSFQGMRSDPPNAGVWYTITDIQQQLPSIQTNKGLSMYDDIGAFRLQNLQISTSQSGYKFDGFFSVYLQLSFYCSDSTEYFDYAQSYGAFSHVSITTELATYNAKVQFNKNNNNNYVWYDGLNYIQTFIIKIDFRTHNVYNVLNIGDTGSNYVFQSNSQTGKKWLVTCDNFSVVKYKNEQQFSESDTLLQIAQSLTSVSSDIPQIIQYLSNIYDSVDDLEHQLNNANSSLSAIYTFLTYNLANSSYNYTLYDYIRILTNGLTSLGSGSSTTLWYKLCKLTLLSPNFQWSDLDDLSNYSLSFNQSSTGYLDNLSDILNSLLTLKLWDFTDKQNTLNSAGYQSGQDVADNINSNNGFGKLSSFSSSASGFGNISLIGNIFNGLGSAFRWFSNQTKNNIDNVPVSRRNNDIVTNYYQSGLNEANEYLSPSTSETGD